MSKLKNFVMFLPLIFITSSVGLGNYNTERIYQAKVIQVENSPKSSRDLQQIIVAQFLDGPYYKKTVQLLHDYNGYPTDLKYGVGHLLFVEELDSSSGQRFVIAGPVRESGLYILAAIFIVFVIITAGFQGIRSIISLSLIFITIVYFLIPSVIRGSNPITVTLILAALSTVVTIFFVSGINHKTVAAVIGTVSGLLTAGLLAWYFGNMILLTGYSDESVQMLQYTSSAVNFQGLLFSGIIIGALGAIMDIAVSIASSITEIKQSNPKISFNSLVASGFRVAKDAISTMTNTLVLAYVGSSFSLLMLYQIHRTPYSLIINHDAVASEIVRMLAGSTGLLAAVPVTVFVSAFLSYEKS